MVIERRIFERYPCNVLASCIDSNNASLGVKCYDLSARGVGVASLEYLPVETRLRLNLCTKTKTPLAVEGIVRWCSKTPEEWRAGVEFSKRLSFPLVMVV
ncbi:MAG: PilZ domain-containing protein [Candidatus Omnitrophota bacterium]